VLVCKQHRTGIINLDRHLQEQHRTPIALQQQVVDYFLQFSTVDPSTIELPEQPALPVEELGAPLDGMKCKACSFITINKGNMKTHCKKSHKLSWSREESTLYDSVKVQTFFSRGGLQKYFIVDLEEDENGGKLDLDQVVQQQLNEYQKVQQQIEDDMHVMEEAAKTDKTSWFKRTG
jgi:hypothetical protein